MVLLAERRYSLKRSARTIWALAKCIAWTKAGVWENVLAQLIQQDIVDETTFVLDSTSMKVHQHAGGSKKGGSESKGRSRGGLTTKVHVVIDGLGNPLCFLFCCGNKSNICMAQELLSPFD